MDRRYNVGAYVRLSVEDSANSAKRRTGNPFQGESTSVENQRAILAEYVMLRGWNLVREYSDDGYSGGNFQRPGFLQMVEDARAGLIDMVLVKDLSRLGRDYIEVGRYTEEVFPALGVRFIALMDDLDSEGNTDLMPFRSLLNDYHLKDLSRKIKSVLHAKAEAGAYVGAFAPYGYRKSEADPGRLVVDSVAAAVICRIFELRLQGMGYGKITGILNSEGLLAPRAYLYESDGLENPYHVMSLWQQQTIKHILKNEVYLGHSVKFKKRTISYKSNALVDRPEEQWIRVDNTHEAIIPQDMWDAAQSVNLWRDDPVTRKTPEPSLFGGLLYCDNGHLMIFNLSTKHYPSGVKKYRQYYCGVHKQTGRAECSWHYIPEPLLLQLLREDIRSNLEVAAIDEKGFIRRLRERMSLPSLNESKKELQKLSERLSVLNKKSVSLYEDRLSGAISLDTYKSLSAANEKEITTAQSEHDRLAVALDAAERIAADVKAWISLLREYLSLEQPDRETLRALIERIEVSEREGRGKIRRQDIWVTYRFVGRLK